MPPMLLRYATCIFILISCHFTTYSQSTCPPNLDFEMGNFDNWQCFTGNVTTAAGANVMNLNPSAPTPNRHEIISAANNPGLDRFGNFPMLCPYGGNYSVKLGNEGTGAQAEAISYTFVVPSTTDTFTFTYFYAVVFEDPQHDPIEQPRFFVTAYDVGTGQLINCASYDYISTASLPGFQRSAVNTNVLYKPWSPTSLQFAGLGGHTVRLEFRTADCTRSGHFGYAYMDIASACSNILATAPYCVETNSLILDAPFGFQTYTWYNADFSQVIGSGQSFTLSPPPSTSGMFYVDVVPYPGFGCRDTLQAFVTPLPVPPLPDGDDQFTYCQNQSTSPFPTRSLSGHTLLWYTSPTGGVPSNTTPVPATNVPGVFKYYVSQKALFGCESFRKEITVHVIPTPVNSFSINTIRQCEKDNNFIFASTATNLLNASYTWDFGNSQTFTSTDTFATHNYGTTGNFNVKLKITNAGRCSAERTRQVTVVPKPLASFTFPTTICENQTSITLTDKSTVPGNVSTINSWWWNINGSVVQAQTPTGFTAPGGPLPVRLAVSTIDGCHSDTSTAIINVRFAPLVKFKIGDLMCNNEIIRFTDQSEMPAAAGAEAVTKWYWSFDGSITPVTNQNPTRNFISGNHNAQLISESNFGCKSPVFAQAFEIFPKPLIDLSITDSCVFVPVTYTAADIAGNVVKWNWDFGNGFRSGSSNITANYNTAGDRPFTVMTFTDHGCKDTIIRPFTIYDNKSFAGRDTVAAFTQPVQLTANGEPNMRYTWSPATGLDRWDIEKPIALLDHDQQYRLYTVTEKGCKKTTDIMIKRYAGPDIYIPNAFTPNNDGLNDRFKVTPVGIKSFGYLAVYNRWGQLIYRSSNYSEGWDGKVGGVLQASDTYVYVAQAIDYNGKSMLRKGTVILIR